MAAPVPKPRVSKASQDSMCGSGLELPPPPSFPPPNRPNVPLDETEQNDGDYVNSSSIGDVHQGSDTNKPSTPDLPDDSPRTGLKPKNKAPPPPPGARASRTSNSPVLATKNQLPSQPQSIPQLKNEPDPSTTKSNITSLPPLSNITSPTTASTKPLTSMNTPTKPISAMPTRPPPPSLTRPQPMFKTQPSPQMGTKSQPPLSLAPKAQLPSTSVGNVPIDAVVSDSSATKPILGRIGEDAIESKNTSPTEESVVKDILKPKRQAPPRPPVKAGSGAGDQTDSAESLDGSQQKENVAKGGMAKEDGGKVEDPRLKPGVVGTGEDTTKATPPLIKMKPFSKVGRVALPGMIPSGEKKVDQVTSSVEASKQSGDMSRTDMSRTDMSRTEGSKQLGDLSRTEGSKQPGDMSRTEGSKQPGDLSRTEGSKPPGDLSRTTEGSKQPGNMNRTSEESKQPGDMSRTSEGSKQPGGMSRTSEGSKQPGDMSRTSEGSKQPGDMSRASEGYRQSLDVMASDNSRQPGNMGKLTDSSTMLWDMANMGVFSIELHRGSQQPFGLTLTAGKLKCITGSAVDGIFIQKVLPSTPASKDGRVQEGDMLLEVANRSTLSASVEEATRMLLEASEDVKLKIGRPPDGAVSLCAEDCRDKMLPKEVQYNEGIDELRELNMKLKAELQRDLETQAAQFSIERRAIESDLEKLKRELDISKNEHLQALRKEQQQISELAQALATITMEKFKVDKELEAVRLTSTQNSPEVLSTLREEVCALQLQLSSLKSELSAVKEEKKNLSQQLQECQHQLQESQRQLDRELEVGQSTLTQNSNLTEELSSLRGEVSTLQLQLSNLRKELSDVYETKRSIEEQLQESQKQLVSCQKDRDTIAESLQIAISQERERVLNSTKDELMQCTSERDELSAKVSHLSETLEQERRKYQLFEQLLAVQSSQSNGPGDSPVLMMSQTTVSQLHEMSIPVHSDSEYNKTIVISDLREPSCSSGTQEEKTVHCTAASEESDSGDLAVLKEHTNELDNVISDVASATDASTLFLTQGSSAIHPCDDPQLATPSDNSQLSCTPSQQLISDNQPMDTSPLAQTSETSKLETPLPNELAAANTPDSVPSLASSKPPEGKDITIQSGDVATLTNESIAQDQDAMEFSDILPVNRLDSSQNLHKRELGTKLRRKRPSKSHLQKMGQESGINMSTGDLTLRAESPEGPDPSTKVHKAPVPTPKRAASIDDPELLTKPHTEAHKAPVPVPRPKPNPRTKGSKPAEDQESSFGTADSKVTAMMPSDSTTESKSRPASTSEENAVLGIKNSPRPSPMSSPKPSPKHMAVKSVGEGEVKGKVDEIKVQSDDHTETKSDTEVKEVPKPLPKPRLGTKIASEVDHQSPVDLKTQVDEIATKDPSVLTIKERALLAQRLLTSKDKPKGPPVAKKTDSQLASAPELETNQTQQDVQNTVMSSEPLVKPKKLPPGAFSMVMPGIRKPLTDLSPQEATPGNASVQMPETTLSSDCEQAPSISAEVAENREYKKSPAVALTMVLPDSSPANIPCLQKPLVEANVDTSNKQDTENAVEASPQRSWSSGAKKLPPGAFNMTGEGTRHLSGSGQGTSQGPSGQSPQRSRDAPAPLVADKEKLNKDINTPPSVKRPLDSAMVTPPAGQCHSDVAAVPTAKQSPGITVKPLTSVDSLPGDTGLLPPPSQPLPSNDSQPQITTVLLEPTAAKDDAEDDNLSLNEENVNTSRTEDLMADNASTDGLEFPSNDGLDYDKVLMWNTTQVGKWLANAGLGQYMQAFMDKNIVGSALLELDGSKLKSTISDADDRNTFKKKVKGLKAHVEKQKKTIEKQKKEEKKKQEAEKKQQKKKIGK